MGNSDIERLTVLSDMLGKELVKARGMVECGKLRSQDSGAQEKVGGKTMTARAKGENSGILGTRGKPPTLPTHLVVTPTGLSLTG